MISRLDLGSSWASRPIVFVDWAAGLISLLQAANQKKKPIENSLVTVSQL